MKDVNKFWNNRKSDSLYKASLRPLGGTLIRSFTEGEPRQGTENGSPCRSVHGSWAPGPSTPAVASVSSPHPTPLLGVLQRKALLRTPLQSEKPFLQ